jgi:hypothetical protein
MTKDRSPRALRFFRFEPIGVEMSLRASDQLGELVEAHADGLVGEDAFRSVERHSVGAERGAVEHRDAAAARARR